jgi:hypothetical protein
VQELTGKKPGAVSSVVFLLASVWFAGLSGHAQAASSTATSFQLLDTQSGVTSVRPPCGVGGFLACAEVLSRLKTAIFGQVKTHIDAAYAGKILASGGGVVPTELIRTPICNLTDKVYGGTSEEKDNHLLRDGASCGQPCTFKCVPPAAGQTDVSCSMLDTGSSCSKERAWIRGAAIQEVWNAYDLVAKEMAASPDHRLSLSSACQVLVQEPQTAQTFAKANAEIVRFRAINQGRPVSCPTATPSPAAEASRTAVAEQAGCFLASTRAVLESLIATVATCEVFARGWKNFTDRDAIIMQEGLPGAQAKLSRAACIASKGSATAFESCLNADYAGKVQNGFTDHMRSIGNAPTERPASAAK